RAQRFRGRPGDRLGQLEVRVVLGLAEVEAPVQLGETDDLRALSRGLPDSVLGGGLVRARVAAAAHLHESNLEPHGGRRYRNVGGRATNSCKSGCTFRKRLYRLEVGEHFRSRRAHTREGGLPMVHSTAPRILVALALL